MLGNGFVPPEFFGTERDGKMTYQESVFRTPSSSSVCWIRLDKQHTLFESEKHYSLSADSRQCWDWRWCQSVGCVTNVNLNICLIHCWNHIPITIFHTLLNSFTNSLKDFWYENICAWTKYYKLRVSLIRVVIH